MLRVYDRGLRWVLCPPAALRSPSTIALAILTGWRYVTIPKGLFPGAGYRFHLRPGRGARGHFLRPRWSSGRTSSPPSSLTDPAVSSRHRVLAAPAGFNPSENVARIYIQLKPFSGTRRLGPAGHPASATQGGKGAGPSRSTSRRRRIFNFGGRLKPHRVPVHADLERPGLARSLGAGSSRGACTASREIQDVASDQQITAPPSRHRGRPRHGLAARRFAVGRSTRPSTTLSASARWRRSTARPPSTRSCSRRRRISTRIPAAL